MPEQWEIERARTLNSYGQLSANDSIASAQRKLADGVPLASSSSSFSTAAIQASSAPGAGGFVGIAALLCLIGLLFFGAVLLGVIMLICMPLAAIQLSRLSLGGRLVGAFGIGVVTAFVMSVLGVLATQMFSRFWFPLEETLIWGCLFAVWAFLAMLVASEAVRLIQPGWISTSMTLFIGGAALVGFALTAAMVLDGQVLEQLVAYAFSPYGFLQYFVSPPLLFTEMIETRHPFGAALPLAAALIFAAVGRFALGLVGVRQFSGGPFRVLMLIVGIVLVGGVAAILIVGVIQNFGNGTTPFWVWLVLAGAGLAGLGLISLALRR